MKYLTLVVACLIASTSAVQIRSFKDGDKKEEEKGTPQNNLDYWAREKNLRQDE